MAKIVRITDTHGNPIEFEDEVKASGGMKDAYFSPKRDYVVLLFRDKPKPGQRERLEKITDQYRRSIFEQEGGEYLKKLYCWPYAVVEHKGRFGVVYPSYDSAFFFKYGSVSNDALGLKGEEKEGNWFASARLRRCLVPRELGDYSTHLELCLQLARSVHHLHAVGLTHSDLSFKNILVDPTTGRACMLIDIDGLVVPGWFPSEVIGTPDFIAPEVIQTQHLPSKDPNRKLPSRQTDLHALAVLIYMYLLYRHPLSGSKIHHEDTQTDQLLAMGEKALFIEHPTDASNRRRASDIDDRELPWADTSKVPCSVTGPYLTELFQRAFVEGLHNPAARPTADDWINALVKTVDLIQPCRNPSCLQKWFVFDMNKPCCPFCGTPAERVPTAKHPGRRFECASPKIANPEMTVKFKQHRIGIELHLPVSAQRVDKTLVNAIDLFEERKVVPWIPQSLLIKPSHKPLFRILPQKGKEHSHSLAAAIDLDELMHRFSGTDLHNLNIRFPKGLGLEYRADTKSIAGTPEESGSFEVEFVVHDKISARQQSFHEKLEVIPDPRSMWNSIPSESQYRGTPGWKPDQDIKHKQGAQAKILAARVQGQAHAHGGSPCEDDMFVEIQDGWHILVVADGAGSVKLSRLGSKLAVEAAGKFLVNDFLKNPQMAAILRVLESEEPKEETLKSIAVGSVGRAAYQAYMAIINEVKTMEGVTCVDLLTSLHIGLARPLRSGGWFFFTFGVGDGLMGLYRRNEEPILFGTLIPGQIRFLDADSVSTSLDTRVRFQFVDRFDAFVSMTCAAAKRDLTFGPPPSPGIVLSSEIPLPPDIRSGLGIAWDEFWNDLEQEVSPFDDVEQAATRLLTYLRFESPGNHDDRTLAILLPTRDH